MQPNLTEHDRYDVLVVGAGPAGASAARAAVEAGASVLLIDRRKRIGEPVQCAEYIPRLLPAHVKIPEGAVVQEVTTLVTFLPDGQVVRKSAPGFILDRARFDRGLAEEAARAGVRILPETQALSQRSEGIILRRRGNSLRVNTDVIVGADGPRSTVGAWVGRCNRRFLVGLQHTVMLRQPMQDTEVYLGCHYPGGYAWLFPKGDRAHVGVGIKPALGGALKPALAHFKRHLGDRIGPVVAQTGGLIPVGGPLKAFDEVARVLLAGDAAGQTHAITGGGIPQAVICGAMAGQAAAEAAGGDGRAFARYEKQWRSVFGALLDRAASKREEMESQWHAGELSQLLRRCWIACPEYHHAA
jgi:geranylgeranyl reductase family protein